MESEDERDPVPVAIGMDLRPRLLLPASTPPTWRGKIVVDGKRKFEYA